MLGLTVAAPPDPLTIAPPRKEQFMPATEFRVRTGVLAAVSYVVFFVLSLVLPGLLGQNRGASIVTPYSTNSEVAAYLAATSHGGPPIAAFCQALSGLALLVFAGWSTSYLHRFDAHAALARTAGTAAAVFLLLSASAQWILALPGIADNLAVYRAVTDLSFTTGAAVQVATTGLLTAAVSAGARDRLPKWLAWFGLGVAALSVLSMLSVLAKGFSPFLPIGRYLGMAWFLGLAALLPRRAGRRARAATP
ncbi:MULTISPECIES: hypothetical protein [Amycolatopsis]|uniref:DUF4386 domain-containing protein n=1 Tax=Amycolatopsis albidoflavus TaxID=102226 RepID=A0ABW5I7G7_9PSEU